ncbi:MAG TPA: hypothetical protein VHG35_17460 [Gemmatimonadales bacterium]|nr:hypothetical protein [Gemmatimonadales bacterium]
MNAGPNIRSDFHVVGNIFDRVYPGGNVNQVIEGVQTYMVPTGDGAVFELEFAEGQSATSPSTSTRVRCPCRRSRSPWPPRRTTSRRSCTSSAPSSTCCAPCGARGGYRLGVSPGKLRIATIVEPFLPPAEHRCIMGRTRCCDDTPCGAHVRWKAVKEDAAPEDTAPEDTAALTPITGAAR